MPQTIIRFVVRAVFVISLLFGFNSLVFAATNVSGTISANTVWSAVNGPYIISGQLLVSASSTLTIEPGVVVKFVGSTSYLDIRGSLIANGTATDKIYFTSFKDDTIGGDTNGDGSTTTPAASDWNNIVTRVGASAQLSNTVVRYGGSAPYGYGGSLLIQAGVYNESGTVNISNSHIYNNGSYGFYQTTGVSTVSSSELDHQNIGLSVAGGNATITGNNIHDNGGYGVSLTTPNHTTVTGNNIHNNTSGGLSESVINGTDATYNYWGDPSGPFHATQNPNGVGNKVIGVFAFAPWLTSAPDLSGGGVIVPPVACTINCNSNVMFLPGIMGSRLYDEQGEEIWVSGNNVLHKKLGLSETGTSTVPLHTMDDTHNNGELNETGIVDDVYSSNIYQLFIEDLHTWKADGLFADYAFIPYDWRMSLNDIITNGTTTPSHNLSYNQPQDFSESYILKQLEQLQKTSRTGKVTIVAHSNGGLVTKALIEKLKDTSNPLYDKIDKVILIAVPQVGTPDAMMNLLHGVTLGYEKQTPVIGAKVTLMSPADMRDLLKNMPVVYNALPSASYFTTVNQGYANSTIASFPNDTYYASSTAKYGSFIQSENELKDYILNKEGRPTPNYFNTNLAAVSRNSFLYTEAQNMHALLDNWVPPTRTKVIQVAGWGEETLAGIDYTYPGYASFNPRHVVDGDGTVVVPSALWMATSTPNVERWWINLEKEGGIFINRKHRDILEVDNLRKFVKSEIDGLPFTDPDNIIVDSTSSLTSDKERLHFTLHSPLTLGITDSLGRYTGLDPVTGEIKEEIPNTIYKQYGEVQFLSVPAGLQYTLKLKGYETGTFALDVEKQVGNTVTESTTFQAIPTATSTAVTMDITPVFEVASSTLNIDQSGDGITDVTLDADPSGVTIYDLTAPVTTATPAGTLGTNGYYTSSVTVILSAEDVASLGEVSSGVVSTRYSLDGGVVWDTYSTSTPLVIATEGTSTLQYYSVDNSGNSEIPKTLTFIIDTIAPTIFASDVSVEQLTTEGTALTIPATVEDSIDTNPTLTTNVPLTQTFTPGVTNIYLTAQDMAGNIATSSIAVTVYSSPTADPDQDGVPNQDDVKPFDATVFANLTIPDEYALWEKESFDLPFSVAGKGNVTLSLSNTYYRVGTSPVKDSSGAIVPTTVTTTDGVTTVSFVQGTKELKTYTLTLTTTKGNTKERDSIRKKRDHEGDEERRLELDKELKFASAEITLSITNTTASKTTSQTSVVNIYDKQQTAQLQYKYKDTNHSTTLLLKSDDVLKLKKGQPLELTVKVTGIKKDIPFTINIVGNFTMLNVVQEEEHDDNNDRKQTRFSLFYSPSTSSTQESITITTTVNGITQTDIVGVRFED